jgi:hypothetical protein
MTLLCGPVSSQIPTLRIEAELMPLAIGPDEPAASTLGSVQNHLMLPEGSVLKLR